MSSRGSLLSTTILSGVAAGAQLMPFGALAADAFTKAPMANAGAPFIGGAAVDGLNGKVDAFGGTMANKSFGGFGGSVSMPLATQYGAQIDVAAGLFDSKMFATIGGHVFWRDPSRGLVGIYANHTYWNQFGGLDVSQIAGEGEYYLGRWTVQGIVGIEFGNSATRTTGFAGTSLIETYDVKTRFFDEFNVGYYITENWKAFVGHRYVGGKNALALGTEWAFQPRSGMFASLFVEGRVGEGDFHGVWGGVKFYFGQREKTLMARHREDDPIKWNPSLFSITNTLKKTTGTTVPAAGMTCPLGEVLIDGFCV